MFFHVLRTIVFYVKFSSKFKKTPPPSRFQKWQTCDVIDMRLPDFWGNFGEEGDGVLFRISVGSKNPFLMFNGSKIPFWVSFWSRNPFLSSIGSKNPSRIAPFDPSGLSDSELEFELAAEKQKKIIQWLARFNFKYVRWPRQKRSRLS